MVIPYAGINEVELNKTGDRLFKTRLHPEGGKPLVITNKYHTTEKTVEDRSRAYSTFIRVLHFHLKDKSKAHFVSGNSPKALGMWVGVAAALGFVVSLVMSFFGMVLFNPLFDGILITVIFGLIALVLRLGRLPKSYLPTEIPLEFLP